MTNHPIFGNPNERNRSFVIRQFKGDHLVPNTGIAAYSKVVKRPLLNIDMPILRKALRGK